MSNDLAGFGGNVRYIRTVLEGTYYYPIADQMTLSVGGSAGNVTGLWANVRILDRFFMGGDNLRGFQTGGAGPRDIPTNAAVGGNNLYTGRLQMTYPLGLPNELGILGRVWTDAGSSFGVDNQTATVADSAFVRIASGVGLSWKSPFGPIGVDFGYPWRKTSYDRRELFRFSFGTRF
jgi:outer membrane protein insertion porin family